MSPTRSGMLGPHIGIALAPDRVWAIRRRATGRLGRRDQPHVKEIAPLGSATSWPALADALRSLREEIGTSGGTLAVALLPPLVQLRRIDLPPIDDDAARVVLSRGAARYFVGIHEPQVVSVSRIVRGWRRSGTVIAAATSARLGNAIAAAAAEAGWRVASIAPAHAAWVAAAQADAPRIAKGSAQLVVLRDDGTDLIRIDRGTISGVRYFAQAGGWVEQLVDALVSPGDGDGPLPTLAAGSGPRREQLVAALRSRGVVVAGGGGSDALADTPEATAAAHASASQPFDLLPAQLHLVRQRRVRQAVVALAGVAAVALVVAAWAQLWGARRELAVVRAERAQVKAAVGEVIEARRVIEDIERRLAALAPFEEGATRWSTVIGALATHLPRDAHIVSLNGTADTVAVEGIALDASGVFRSLRRAPGFTSVSPVTAIRRDLTESGAPIDRFTLAASIAPRDSSAPSRSTPRGGPRGAPRGSPRGAGRGGTR